VIEIELCPAMRANVKASQRTTARWQMSSSESQIG
jgi:hypothetical protein